MTAPRLSTFDIAGIEPQDGAPAPDRLISGNPQFRTWNLEDPKRAARRTVKAGVIETTRKEYVIKL